MGRIRLSIKTFCFLTGVSPNVFKRHTCKEDQNCRKMKIHYINWSIKKYINQRINQIHMLMHIIIPLIKNNVGRCSLHLSNVIIIDIFILI